MLIHANDTVLFQGDSITDAGRDRAVFDNLGPGYPARAAALFAERHPDMGVRFLNRGVSGDRSGDMLRRWGPDCLDLKPDVVSIMIGVNDTWRRYDRGDPSTTEQYAANLEEAIRQVKAAGARLVIISPYLLPAEDKAHWRAEDFDAKRDACRALAERYADAYLPMDDIFRRALAEHPEAVYSEDGVHPNAAGADLIAAEWVKLIESK